MGRDQTREDPLGSVTQHPGTDRHRLLCHYSGRLTHAGSRPQQCALKQYLLPHFLRRQTLPYRFYHTQSVLYLRYTAHNWLLLAPDSWVTD